MRKTRRKTRRRSNHQQKSNWMKMPWAQLCIELAKSNNNDISIFKLFQLQFCTVEYPRSSLEHHEQNECDDRPTECKYSIIGCQWKGPKHESKQHELTCAHPKSERINESIKNRKRLIIFHNSFIYFRIWRWCHASFERSWRCIQRGEEVVLVSGRLAQLWKDYIQWWVVFIIWLWIRLRQVIIESLTLSDDFVWILWTVILR